MVIRQKTKHIEKRQQQRGLRKEILELILDFGHVTWGAEALCYCLQQRLLPSYLKGTEISKKAESWVVLVAQDNGIIITAYPRNNPSYYIRRKCRRKD